MNNKDLVTELNLETFKKNYCDNHNKHNINTCINYHNEKDYIRSFKKINYKPIWCKNRINSNNCEKKENCLLSHNIYEYYYHPENYKKYFCKFKNNCKLNLYCPHAHTNNELKIKKWHLSNLDNDFYLNSFKTVPCPFKYIEHNKRNCEYYHTFWDMRRSIEFHQYHAKNCNIWNFNNIKLYGQGCKNGTNCKFSHGLFENFYHPNNFKKKNCKNLNKCKNKHCSFIH